MRANNRIQTSLAPALVVVGTVVVNIMAAIAIASSLAGSGAHASDQIPGAAPDAPIALVGGSVYPVDRDPIGVATVLIVDGKVTAIGKDIDVPDRATRVDVSGRRIYPGLIACGTQLGLVEIGAVRATRDESEVGVLNPNVRAEVSVNPDSELIPVSRANGIALALSHPQGGTISGRSALLRLDGWTYEELTYRAPVGLHVNWPNMHVDVPGNEKRSKERRETRDQAIDALRSIFRDAAAYREAAPGGPIDLRLEALVPCLERKTAVFFHANEERQIRGALDFAAEFELRAVLVGGRDAALVTDRLAGGSVPVIFGPVHALPGGRDADYDAVFTTPSKLYDAGVPFAIAGFWTSNTRNLPYHAATAAAYGLPPEIALRAITLSPAEILGVAERVGSITVGKDATLIITDGDPLEITTQVVGMYIDGRPVDLSSRHTLLYDKYRKRLEEEKSKKRRSF